MINNAPELAVAESLEPIIEWRCGVCGSTGPFERHHVHENMFGLDESFEYRLCFGCGCMQIVDVPTDLWRYYGSGYYSLGKGGDHGPLATIFIRARNRHLSGRFDPIGAWLARHRSYAALSSLRPLKFPRDARIVDVGCGNGELLRALQSAGFTRLLGLDPFVARDIDLGGGLMVKRAELVDLVDEPDQSKSFNLVMFHHSLEHIDNPALALRSAWKALLPGGYCIVRIPTVSSYAWRYYGVNWCGLDAPRHLMLHSRRSIALMAVSCGFEIVGSADDSTAFQFWGSEQYRRGITLMRPSCNEFLPVPGEFTSEELRIFGQRAAKLNRDRDGDQIIVYLRRPVV